ncbi:unnamed protein product [Ranitomeya imitator]|uniref:Reverse transcriptase n=1 Tax=Ranitomeya imitator TaxID=111125 RepID=A0ABN9KWK8_9NEOB|nr:unnamed protein product [Ranitomeya imitator]
MDTDQCREEISGQLSDPSVYESLYVNPTQAEDALLQGTIDQKLAEYLVVDRPIVPILYTLPKIHKNLNNPPRHPIVLGRGFLFNRVAIFLDCLLRKFAMAALSYTKDTSDFIKSLEAEAAGRPSHCAARGGPPPPAPPFLRHCLEGVQVGESTFLASFDAVSLYTSIEQDKVLPAVDMMLAGSDMVLRNTELG